MEKFLILILEFLGLRGKNARKNQEVTRTPTENESVHETQDGRGGLARSSGRSDGYQRNSSSDGVTERTRGEQIVAKFGERSKKRLATVDPRLREVLEEAIKVYDFTILQGVRSKEEQQDYFERGLSKVQWPESKHNLKPGRNEEYSLAADIAPWPIDWNDLKRFYYLAGIVVAIGEAKGYKIRWGGNWDRDYDFDDQKFNDLPHFEILD